MSQRIINRLANAFDPLEALTPGDPRYVECSKERGSVGLLKALARTIRTSQGRTCQLLSGHRGSGKTTELFRLRQDLLDTEPRYFVVYCESDTYVSLNDVEYTDVLLAVVQQLWADATKEGIALAPGRLRGLMSDLAGVLLAPVDINKVEFGAGIAKLSAEVKMNPTNRDLVRSHLRPRATPFLEAINEVIERADEAFKDKGYDGLVVIVDNLDRVYRNPVPNTARTSHDALFIDAADYLRDLACNVIYTMPPAMLYSPNGPRLARLFGSTPRMLPMIPVTTRAGDADERGVSKLSEAIEKRLRVAGTTSRDAFDSEETMRRLCVVSGGYTRLLMTLMQTAINDTDSLPITAESIERTIRGERNQYLLSIRATSQWQLLRRVAETKQIADSEDYLQMVENFVVLEYLDDDGPWYEVNPIVREARQFKT